MLNKHPQAPPLVLPSDQFPSPAKITEAAVRQGVRSFPNVSAPGPSGLCPTHLRDAVGCPSPDRSSHFWPLAKLHPPSSPSLWGHPSRHPEKEWRSPAHHRRGSSAAADVQVPLLYLPFHSLFALAPLKLGVGVKGGCEAIIHAISSLISAGNPTPHRTPLFDFSNAFDNISREAMFKQIRRHVSSLGVDGVLLLISSFTLPGQRHRPQLLWGAAG